MRLFLIFGSLHRSGCVTARIELDRKASGGNGPRALRPLDKIGAVIYRLRRVRLWQVGQGDLSPDAGLLLRITGEGSLARNRLLGMERGRKKRGKGEEG